MNRRQFLINFEKLCLAYGLQGVLSPSTFAISSKPSRLINFVIKYTGGTTDEHGIGQWTTNSVLSPLAPYASDMVFPLGLSAKFDNPMNVHAAPQVSALTGSLSGYEAHTDAVYPLGNLQNFSSGEGKSIDVLIGEKLQAEFATAMPYLLISNHPGGAGSNSTDSTSSWGNGGELIHSLATTEGLRAEIAHRASCEKFLKTTYASRLKALNYIQKNHKLFSSHYLIDKNRVAEHEENFNKNVSQYEKHMGNINRRGQVACDSFSIQNEIEENLGGTYRTIFSRKMEKMYDLGIIALKENVTRVLTFNLWLSEAHEVSHHSTTGIDPYYDVSRFYQSSIASFIKKLVDNNMYSDTLIFCNAGSCIKADVHNVENLSTYIVNGGATGIRGSVNDPKPIGSLLLDILHKFDIKYSEYGARDHFLGVSRKGNFI